MRRFGRRGHASRLGSLVLDEYLRVMERHYFGRAGASAAVPRASASTGDGAQGGDDAGMDLRQYDAVLFDMDGVLCDSELLSREAAVSVLRKLHGVYARPEEFAAFTGMGEGAFLEGVANLHGVKDFDQEKAKQAFFEEYINGGFVFDLRPFPGVRQLVARVRALGLRVAVASAADKIKVDANLKAIGLASEFDFVASSELIERKKPAPDVFLAAADGVGVPPERCVVVEDAAAGVQAAKAAGMRCVAVTTSLDDRTLIEAGADLVRLEPAAISIADLLDEDPDAVEEELAELANADSTKTSNTPTESASASGSASRTDSLTS